MFSRRPAWVRSHDIGRHSSTTSPGQAVHVAVAAARPERALAEQRPDQAMAEARPEQEFAAVPLGRGFAEVRPEWEFAAVRPEQELVAVARGQGRGGRAGEELAQGEAGAKGVR